MAEIGKRIRESRKEKNLTQQELSEQVNVSRSAVANWEVGRNYPDLDSIVHLSDILGISLDYLLREDIVMIKKVSGEQRKNVIRKRMLTIIVPVLVVFMCITGYLLYQDVGVVHQFFSPQLSTAVTITDKEKNTWQRVEFEDDSYLQLNGIFWEKEIINDASSESTIDIGIYEHDGVTLVDEFTLKAGEGKKMKVKIKTDYVLKVRANNGVYRLNFI